MTSNKTSWKIGLGGLAAATGIRAWMSTLEYRAFFYDPVVEAAGGCERPRIYVFWHEYILIPLYLRGHCDLAMLLSRHRDADILTRVAYHMGFDCVRGSTNRGAVAALRELSQLGQHMHLAITPDGPRGPRRQLAQGPIYLASTLGMPIVPIGFGVDRPWRAKSWDRSVFARSQCAWPRDPHPAEPRPRRNGGLSRACRTAVDRSDNRSRKLGGQRHTSRRGGGGPSAAKNPSSANQRNGRFLLPYLATHFVRTPSCGIGGS